MKYEWVTEIEDRTPEWFEYRNNGLGASSAAIVCALSPYKPTPMQLFHDKVGTMEPDRTMSAPAFSRSKICLTVEGTSEVIVFVID